MQATTGDSSANTGDAPIYERLVRERGDIPEQARRIAERTLQDSRRAVNFGAARQPVTVPVVAAVAVAN